MGNQRLSGTEEREDHRGKPGTRESQPEGEQGIVYSKDGALRGYMTGDETRGTGEGEKRGKLTEGMCHEKQR